MTREEKIDALNRYCDNIDDCDNCKLMKKYDKTTLEWTSGYSCRFSHMSYDMLSKCYNLLKEISPAACENADNECCDKEPNTDMVNHHKNIVEEMRRLFDLFDNNVEIFINKSNKTVDIHIQM